ncbi:MAG TPA: hypothetical protein VLQ80_10125 [Candidatus Saccharimonadia bacterium]|nr:hypothetical protein [Candidatus Saccharimonadia bacterium]
MLTLLLWRLVERALRVHVETTGSTLTGWDKKETQKPTAFMMMTKFAAVIVVKGGSHWQHAQPFSVVQTECPPGQRCKCLWIAHYRRLKKEPY